MKILCRYIDANGNMLEEHAGELGNWSIIPGLAVAVHVAPGHQPKRGDEVEAWIKRERDEFAPDEILDSETPAAYFALDDLLDNYRLRADTGASLETPLSELGGS